MFASSDLADWRPVLASADDCFAESMSYGPLPARLVETLLEDGRFKSLAPLALNESILGGDPALRARLAATGDRGVADAVNIGDRTFQPPRRWWPLRGCRDVLAAARPDDKAWSKSGGVLEDLMYSRAPRRRALVVCPIGRSARSTLVDIPSDLTRAEQLRGLLTVHDHDGGLEQLGHFNQKKFRPEVAGILRTVLAAGDIAVLREAVVVAEGTGGLIEEFREFESRDDALEMLSLRDDLDWEMLRRAHEESPFGEHVLRALATRDDCPADLRPSIAPEDDAPDSSGLAALVAKHLGDNVEAWRAVRTRLPRFQGDLVDLLVEVGEAGPPKKRAKATAWPGAGELPAWDKAASVSGARARFLELLDAASDETQLKLVKHLDDRTVADLFGQGEWRDAWLDFATKARQKRYRLALAQRSSLTTEAIDALMEANDTEVNARLFLRTGATGPQRERLLSGRLDKALIERLMKRDGGFRARDAVNCSDTRLQRHILALVRVRGITPQLRLMLNLWERGGPAAVRDLLENEPKGRAFSRNVIRQEVRRAITKLLAQPEDAEALEELRATVAAGETAEAQIELLRTRNTHPSAEVFREAHLWCWDELIAEHRRRPLGVVILLGLTESPECPRELHDEAERERWRWIERTGHAIEGRVPEEILEGNEAGWWLRGAVREGAVTGDQVIALAAPARHALDAMAGQDAPAALALLVREHLDPSRDAWILALRMLPDFTGTVAELVRTAGSAAAPLG